MKLGRRRRNGRPAALSPAPPGTAPSQVGSFAPGTPTATAIPVSYTAATGTAPITYAGYTSPHGAGTWTLNGGTFNGTGGTFTGLSPSTSYDLHIVASNGLGSSTTDYLVGVTTASAGSNAFTTALAAPSTAQGVPVAMTVNPPSGGWPSGQVVTPNRAAVLYGEWDVASQTGSGTTPLVFNFTPYCRQGIVGTLSASAAGLTNATGPMSLTVATTSPRLFANRFDQTLGAASGPVGVPVTVTLTPNGSGWNGGGTITLAGTGWTGATITIPASGNAPITVSVTPNAAGALSLTVTNTAGLFNPRYAPFTCFAASSGTAQSLGVGSDFTDPTGGIVVDYRTYQRDTFSGDPAGFGTTFGKGWAEYWVSVTALGGATGGLFARLYDADSAGANTTPGTGAPIGSTAQVYGNLSGIGTVRILVPASDFIYYLDLATDSAFTNPVRVPSRFRVGDVMVPMARSQECGWIKAYAYVTPDSNSMVGTSYVNYSKMTDAGWPTNDPANIWIRQDGTTPPPASTDYFSVGAQEAGRFWASRRGVALGLAGAVTAGGGQGFNQFVNADGSPEYFTADMITQRCGGKFRYAKLMSNAGWIGGRYGTGTMNDHLVMTQRMLADWPARYPSLAVIGVSTMSGLGTNPPGGSDVIGYMRLTAMLRDALEPINPMFIAPDNPDWMEWVGGHATHKSKIRFARAGCREVMAPERTEFGGFGFGLADRGAKLSTTGTLVGGTIEIPFTLPAGATQLVPLQWINDTVGGGLSPTQGNFSYSTPTAADLRVLFHVYDEGKTAGASPIRSTGVTIDNAARKVRIALDLSAGPSTITREDNTTAPLPTKVTVHHACDTFFSETWGIFTNPTNKGIAIFDDRTDAANGVSYGWHMRPEVDVLVSTV